MTITMAKEERISLRVDSKTKSLLETAAAARQQSVTEFMLENSMQAAHDAILDRNLFVLEGEDFDTLVERLSDVEENRKRFERLNSIARPWEE